jgi:uncharacterized protein
VKKLLSLFLAANFALLLFLPISATAPEIPHLTDYITDELGTIEYSGYYNAIYGNLELLERETSCVIALLVVNSTEGMEIDQYAIAVFDQNGIGDEDLDNGVLVVLAIGDGAYFVVVGRGLEGILNDAKVGRFARDYYVPNAELGDYGYGAYALTVMLASEIAENYEQAKPHTYPVEGIPLEWPALIIAFLVFIGILFYTRGRIVLWIGPLFRGLGKGKTGGGGAGGKHK